ncbi:MAG: hypothetical protein ACRDMX_16555 [Solirubrobacteraceae bacterium]
MSMTVLRRVASALVPESGKRRIDAARNRGTMIAMAPANREFVRRHGLRVSGGPFAGMGYLPGLERSQGDLVAKLLGGYESELHGAIEAWRTSRLTTIVNVGCAEGYYAVGIASLMPDAQVLAYDIDPRARELCRRLAEHNEVADRVRIESACTPAGLLGLPAAGVGLLCDCEGCELGLLDPESVPNLGGWPMIVELHDFVNPTITDTICARFRSSHEIELIRSAPPDPSPPELSYMTGRRRRAVLNERPVAMSWAVMSPRGA